MRPFTVLTGDCVLMPSENIDTDQLIPARFMNRTRSSGYGGYLFYDLRYDAHGAQIPEFELNKTSGSEVILVGGQNFGCGSSREAAVYALLDYGFRAIVAPSFGDIFRNNASKNGLLTVPLTDQDHTEFVEQLSQSGSTNVKIDLAMQTLGFTSGANFNFEIDPAIKRKMLQGVDDLAETLQYKAMIENFERKYIESKPWLFPK
ncbi:3-isopropylmalate dehydratase small subunit [Paracoccaceae bacterium]|nr:3-isopropylmalate dehydratase small subunit [Paracoccaceae bacterium]